MEVVLGDCGSGEDREGKREEERREVKEEEKRRTSIIIFLCVHVGIVYVLCVNWNNRRASVATETLTGVTQSKIGDVCLFIYGLTYVILYFDPPYFCVSSLFDPVPNFTKRNPPV